MGKPLFNVPPKQVLSQDLPLLRTPKSWLAAPQTDCSTTPSPIQLSPQNRSHGLAQQSLKQSPVTSFNNTPRLDYVETSSIPPARQPLPIRPGGCVYETALLRGRRRMPYSIGIEQLERISPQKLKNELTDDENRELTAGIHELYQCLLPTNDVRLNQSRFVQKLERILQDEWPERQIDVHVFGSLGNLLSSDYSEVDICITTDSKELENVCMIADLLAKRGMEKVICVPAKVPIVKIRDPEFDLACHINVNNTLALETTRMIRTYVNIDERVRPLIMVIKYWARRRMINDAAFGGTLSSYTWICMIIGFLQLQAPPVLPALHQQRQGESKATNGQQTQFSDDVDKLRGFGNNNKKTVGELLFSFFKFYAHEFNYSNDALSIRLGGLIPKTPKWRRTVNNMLCIEEPFKTSRNLANSADDISHRGLHIEIRRAFDLISAAKLEECCEQYVFPPEEERVFQRQLLVRRPALVRSSSQQSARHDRGRQTRSSRWAQSKMNNKRPPNGTSTLNYQARLPEGAMPPPIDPAVLMATLEALQFQEQQLQYQLYQHSQAYAQQQALKYVADTNLQDNSPEIPRPVYNNPFDIPQPAKPWPVAYGSALPPQTVQHAQHVDAMWSQVLPGPIFMTDGPLLDGIPQVYKYRSAPMEDQSNNPVTPVLYRESPLASGIVGPPISNPQQPRRPNIPSFILDEDDQTQVSEDAASVSVDPSYDNTQQTVTSLKTKSTELTLPSSARQSADQDLKQNIEVLNVVTALPGIVEEGLVERPESERIEEPNIGLEETICGASTISADSMQLTSAQKVNIVRRFTSMVTGRLARILFADITPTVTNFGFLRKVEGLLKEFSNTVRSQTADRAKSLGCKSIRILRRDIAQELERMLSSEFPLPESTRHLPFIASEADRFFAGQMTFSEKCQTWVNSESQIQEDTSHTPKAMFGISDYEIQVADVDTLTMIGRTSLDAISVSNSTDTSGLDQPHLYPDFINDSNISTYLANHSAFDHLIFKVQQLIEKYRSSKMDLISHRVLDCLQKRRIEPKISDHYHTVVFHVDWDVREFLETQYTAGTDQDLGHSLVFVGQLINAQLSSIEDYFTIVWPRHATAVLEPLKRKLRGVDEPRISAANILSIEDDEITVTASGSEEYIICVAQQLSFLAAACRTSESGLILSHVKFQETEQDSMKSMLFEISVETESPVASEHRGCWNSLAGSSVLVTGFPIPERHHAERGLEAHLGVLSCLLGIRQAVTYRGGYVLKGRSHALIPVVKNEGSVQWHLLDSSPRKLKWTDIDKICPKRVLGMDYKDLKALQTARTFLGWCPRVKNLLGTKEFDYTAVRHSKATLSSKTRLSLSEFSFGFQKIVSASVKFTLGKKDGIYERDRSDCYEGILDDAKNMHIFLYDAKHKCAFHTDAERVILQIILHKHNNYPYTVDGKVISLRHHDGKLDGQAVRRAMLANADTVLKREVRPKDPEPATLLFRDKVSQLYDVLHGFQGHGAGNNITMTMDSSTTIVGWEYMDLVVDKRTMKVKEAKLLKTCGNWPSFAVDEDINGVFLFGQDFGDILRPINADSTCATYSVIPKGKDYLGIQTLVLATLFDDIGGSEDQEQLTASGIAWHCPSILFEICRGADSRTGTCQCDRVQEFALPRNRFDPRQLFQPKIRQPGALKGDGAVIFGLSGIKGNVLKRLGIGSKDANFEGDHGIEDASLDQTSSYTTMKDSVDFESAPARWTVHKTEPQDPVHSLPSQWHVPRPTSPASICSSQASTRTDSNDSNLTIFSTAGLNFRGQDSNSTSIPDASEQMSKSSQASFTRPGVSFAAVASTQMYHWARQSDYERYKLPFPSSMKKLTSQNSGERIVSPRNCISPPYSSSLLFAKTPQVGNRKLLPTAEIIDREVAKTVQAMDRNPERALRRRQVDHIVEDRKGIMNDGYNDPRHGSPEVPSLRTKASLAGTCSHTLRRKKNFVRPVA